MGIYFISTSVINDNLFIFKIERDECILSITNLFTNDDFLKKIQDVLDSKYPILSQNIMPGKGNVSSKMRTDDREGLNARSRSSNVKDNNVLKQIDKSKEI